MASVETTTAGRGLMPHLPQLYRAAMLMAADPGAAEDLVLDSYGTAFAAFDGLSPDADVRVWLYRILIGLCTTGHGAARPGQWLITAAGVPGSPPACNASDAGAADPAAIAALPESDVAAALLALPAQSRMMVHLADIEGFTYSDIAEITGVPAAEVALRLRGARTRLRELLTACAAQLTAPRN